jgi:Flp pilus assembly pilin Flp
MTNRGESGQVLVEYLLGILTALALIMILRSTLDKSIGHLWTMLTQEVAAACPKGCLVDSTISRGVFGN